MDPSVVVSGILFIASILMTVIAFFMSRLVTKIEAAVTSGVSHAVKIEAMEKQLHEISSMKADVAVLKYAIVGYLKERRVERKQH